MLPLWSSWLILINDHSLIRPWKKCLLSFFLKNVIIFPAYNIWKQIWLNIFSKSSKGDALCYTHECTFVGKGNFQRFSRCAFWVLHVCLFIFSFHVFEKLWGKNGRKKQRKPIRQRKRKVFYRFVNRSSFYLSKTHLSLIYRIHCFLNRAFLWVQGRCFSWIRQIWNQFWNCRFKKAETDRKEKIQHSRSDETGLVMTPWVTAIAFKLNIYESF